jgi:hypothetical protein
MKLKLFLTLTILAWSNYGYTWYCTYANGTDGWYDGTSMVCVDIEVSVALEDHYCVWHRPEDPYCSVYQACSDTVEYRTLACTDPNTVGVVNQMRDYYCQTSTFGAWVTTSENCTPAPATCHETSESRTNTCPVGYDGAITEVRNYFCATPYSQGEWTPWVDTGGSCVKSLDNPTNLDSPISPISPISPTNPLVQQQEEAQKLQNIGVIPTPIDDVTAPENVQTLITTQPDLVPSLKEESGETQPENKKEESGTTSTEEPSESEQEQKQEEQEKKVEEKAPDVPEGKALVPGFGLTMSLDILNQGIEIQEIQLNDVLTLIQEQDYATQQNFLIDFVFQDDVDNAFSGIADYRWRSLLYDNPLQSDAFDD